MTVAPVPSGAECATCCALVSRCDASPDGFTPLTQVAATTGLTRNDPLGLESRVRSERPCACGSDPRRGSVRDGPGHDRSVRGIDRILVRRVFVDGCAYGRRRWRLGWRNGP